MKESRLKGAKEHVKKIIPALRKATRGMPKPAATNIIKKYGRDPFLTLIGCILSLRTRDTTSFPASVRLFSKAKTPRGMLKLTQSQIQKLIYPVGFYKTKAKTIHKISKKLIEDHKGKVPKTQEELLELPGVGLKTANLVLAEAFRIPALVVDTHVHRLCNKPHFGLVNTKTAEKTEEALREIVPKKSWIEFNKLVLLWGQHGCQPRKKCVCKTLDI